MLSFVIIYSVFGIQIYMGASCKYDNIYIILLLHIVLCFYGCIQYNHVFVSIPYCPDQMGLVR